MISASLRLLGTVGEPINPEAWMWYHKVIGGERCPIVDTWWQTETGGHMITPTARARPRPSRARRRCRFSASMPRWWMTRARRSASTRAASWSSASRGRPCCAAIWGDKARYKKTYWSEVKGCYSPAMARGATRTVISGSSGRIDDVLNVAGHRLGTAEVESALVSHPTVAEAAVVGRPDELKGQAVVAFVTLKPGVKADAGTARGVEQHVGTVIGPVAKPDEIRFAEALPKTRSGKIMRRLLKEIAGGKNVSGDTTTLEDLTMLARLSSAGE